MKIINIILEVIIAALIVTSPIWMFYYFTYVLNY